MALGVWLIVRGCCSWSWSVGSFFVWGWRSGQFRDVEASKRTMLEDRDPEPWPAKRRPARHA